MLFRNAGNGPYKPRPMNRKLYVILLKRIINSLVVLFFSISFIFLLLRISPGDPAAKFISPGLSPQLVERVRESFNLNSSLIDQYIIFVRNFLKLDLGFSYTFKLPVTYVILQYLPFTVVFALICFFVQICLSLVLLLITGKRRNRFIDKFTSYFFLSVYSIPVFIIGLVLLYLFAFRLNILPSSGAQSIGDFPNIFERAVDSLRHLILPVLTLSIPGTALFYTYLRENAESVYNKTFILYLRSMGISESEILRKHVIPNAVTPMISIAGIELGLLFSGAVITEIIFGLPGIGRLAMDAVFARDYPLITGLTFISGVLITFTNLAADYLKFRNDKRLQKEIIS